MVVDRLPQAASSRLLTGTSAGQDAGCDRAMATRRRMTQTKKKASMHPERCTLRYSKIKESIMLVLLVLCAYAASPSECATINVGFMGDFQDARNAEVFGFSRLAMSIVNAKGSAWHNDLLQRLGRSSILPNDVLQFTFSDSKCNRGGGVEAALVHTNRCMNGVEMVASVGAGCSSASIGAQDLFRYSQIPQFSYAATSPLLSDSNQYPYFGRTVPPDNQQANALLAFLRHSQVTRAGVLSFDDSYTKGLADAFKTFSPLFDVEVPTAAKGVVGYMTHSVYEGVKQLHGDLALVCRLREMHEAGVKHVMIATRADYLFYYVSAILQTGYLREDVQLYITETFYHIRPSDNWDLLNDWQVWYTGHGNEPLNGWWDVHASLEDAASSGMSSSESAHASSMHEPVPMYVKEGTQLHTLDRSTCTTIIGSVDRTLSINGDVISTSITGVNGNTGTLHAPGSSVNGVDIDAFTVVWSDGTAWRKRAHIARQAYLDHIVGILGSGFNSAGPMFEDWFLPQVWQAVDPTEYEDMDGDRDTVTGYSTASFDATLAVALGLDEMIKAGRDYTVGAELYTTIKNLSFNGISGQVAFDSLGDRANSTYEIFNYDSWTTKRVVATVAGPTLTLVHENVGPGSGATQPVPIVYAANRTMPHDDGTCIKTNAATGEMCSGNGVCSFGEGVCVCNIGFLGEHCETVLPPLCTTDHFTITLGQCSSTNKRSGVYSYASAGNCCNSETFPTAPCSSAVSRPPAFETDCDHIVEDSEIARAFFILSIIGIFTMGVYMSMVLVNSNRPEILKGQPPFLWLCCIGGVVGLCTLTVYAGAWTTTRCRMLAALPSTGFTIIMSSIVLKAWRVDTIFNNKSLHLMKVGGIQMLQRFAMLLSVDMALLLLFLLVNNVHSSSHALSVDGRTLISEECTADSFYFGYILLIFKLALMFYGVVLALRVRNVSGDVSESKFIVYSIYNIAIVAVVGGYLYLFGDMDVERSYQALGVCSLLLFTMPPSFMIIPRLVSIFSTTVSPGTHSDSGIMGSGARTDFGAARTEALGVLTTKGESMQAWKDVANCRATAADNATNANEALYEMLAEQQEEIRNLKIAMAAGLSR